MAIVMIVALMSASAAAFTYTPVNGTTITFVSKITKADSTPTPAWTVTYGVSAGDAVTDGGYESVHAGHDANSVTLTNNSTTATGGTVTFTAGGASSYTVTVDFSAVSFTEPGVYRYKLTQTGDAAPGMTLDGNLERNLDVYVHDDNGALKIEGYTLAGKRMGVTGDGKDDGFDNSFVAYDLTVTKTVSGSQASKDKYFKFTITVTGLQATASYTITPTSAASGNNAATKADYRGKTNPTSATGAELAAGVVVYLQHGDSVTISALPKNAAYTVAEDKENYENTAPDNASGSIADSNVSVAFLNTKDGDIPTGVLLTVIPGAVLLGAGVIGFLVMIRKKKNEDEAEEE